VDDLELDPNVLLVPMVAALGGVAFFSWAIAWVIDAMFGGDEPDRGEW